MIRAISLATLLHASLYGVDFGVVGKIRPIAEENFIEVLEARAKQMSLEKKIEIQNSLKRKYEGKLKKPKALNLPETFTYSVRYFDPTIEATEEIVDSEGNIIVKKGEKHSPLETNPLSRDILFFDGDDQEQISWAKKREGVWIIVGGSPLDLEDVEGKAVFFDQNGVICKKFNIQSVPSRISQSGKLLKVEAIPKGALF